ncbi:uncharacterized protein C16orf46 homolog [Maylandia zebra]|uniref:uncharacterized protein C16orf46 homolog n=1 Tax=Maylandia zebra TaxID=106582 RepID=UPI000329E277|nr:uncharacterized protein LOC101475689 [Maylandia zebra]XP_026025625.1 uncharacterized protein LOC113023633 [Astatotilapia calliptera]
MTSQERDRTAVDRADGELSAPENAAGEHEIAERRLVESLLDTSEENFLNEKELNEFHCYSGWEDAVCGWARVVPLSCILLTSNTYKKPEHKEADNGTPSSDDPVPSNGDSSASITEQHCESHAGLDNFKKFVSVNQHTGSWSQTAMAAQQTDAAECPFLKAMQRNPTHLLLEEKIYERGMDKETLSQLHHLSSKYSVPENKPAKPWKHSHRPNNRVVPIKNFTFLPPINPPHLIAKASGHLCRDKKTPEKQTSEKNGFLLDKQRGTRGTRVDTASNSDISTFSAALTSKYQSFWQNPHNVLIPRGIKYNVFQT